MANKDTLFGSVLENSVNTGLKKNLDAALTNAGVKVPSTACMWEYPDIIRKNLVAKTVTGINILGGDVINIDTSSTNSLKYLEPVSLLLMYANLCDIKGCFISTILLIILFLPFEH